MSTEVEGILSKKPTGNLEGVNVYIGVSSEPPAASNEVEGHVLIPSPSPGLVYICAFCGCRTWVPPGIVWYTCVCYGHFNG
jgi:hypothetical protein